eukprot:CAMPEP_0198123652 /NCGR_PEP_ID=MMETSP1442-20131203/38041_1 /TAXON_ID= /ORGANISM="Craspedostauros australis, Strain CCMP3328" /LENGTH=378 /DNA_ID=CAMNT_0043782885 /DNA_START=82 /DNA_END=1218 /DNA_ORIENTATION=-
MTTSVNASMDGTDGTTAAISTLTPTLSSTTNPLWKDLLQVSRPGWWMVSVWLYLAPTGRHSDRHATVGQDPTSSIFMTTLFWLGLLYVCLPLNMLTYGLNDYADMDIDLDNQRKGNWFFGPKGMGPHRLETVLRIAFAVSFVWLFAFIAAVPHQPEMLSWRIRLAMFLSWYAFGVLTNVAYNFKCLGHLSSHGPLETPMVFLGFSLITVFSYWVNVVLYHRSNGTGTLQLIFFGDGDHSLFGCNASYWIHLAFLILRTQLWTEYMDFENDLKMRRTTTLVRFGQTSKAKAKSIVLVVLLVETAWNYSVYRSNAEWLVPFAFALAGPFLFWMMDEALERRRCNPKAGNSTKVLLTLTALQTVGGIALLYETWQKGLFVN